MSSQSFVSFREEGEIPAFQAPDLLAAACASRFDGSLLINTQSGARVAIRFEVGQASRWHSTRSADIVRESLSEHLPEEQLLFVEDHAAKHRLDLMVSVAKLVLLPHVTLLRLHKNCLSLEAQHLALEPGRIRFRHFARRDCFEGTPGFAHPVHALALVSDALSVSQNISWFRERLLPYRHAALVWTRLEPDLDLQGALRLVVQALRRKPESLDMIRLRRLVSEEALVAAAYALLATESVELRGNSATPAHRSSMNHSAPIQQNASTKTTVRVSGSPLPSEAISMPPSRLPAASTMRPIATSSLPGTPSARPGASSTSSPLNFTTPSAGPPSSSRPSDEHTVETSALDAWTRAVADPGWGERALKVAERAADQFPTNPRILFYLGCLLARSGQTTEALTTMERVLSLDPDHTEARRELSLLQKSGRAQSQTRPALRNLFGARKSG